MILDIIIVFLGAISYGWIEQFLFGQAKNVGSGNRKIAGKFAWPYHFPAMTILLFAIAWPWWQLFPLLPLVQDLSYFYFKGRRIKKTSWVSKIAGHFTFKGNVVPYAYLIAIGFFVYLQWWL